MNNIKIVKLQNNIERTKIKIENGIEKEEITIISELNFDLSKVTGRVLLEGEQKVLGKGLYYNAQGINTSIAYQTEIASSICEPRLDSEAILDMGLNDFNTIVGVIKGFLDASDYAYQMNIVSSLLESIPTKQK